MNTNQADKRECCECGWSFRPSGENQDTCNECIIASVVVVTEVPKYRVDADGHGTGHRLGGVNMRISKYELEVLTGALEAALEALEDAADSGACAYAEDREQVAEALRVAQRVIGQKE